jgi:hypothetical protein
MAERAIKIGFPNPNYVVEFGARDAILPGAYEVEPGARSATASAAIGNLTAAATAKALDSATLAQTIAAPTLVATATGTVSASLSATLADLTLSATATVTDSASLAATIDPLTLAATVAVIATASVDATIGPFTLSATVTAAARSRDGVYPWWWTAYVKRHVDERRAAEEKARCERELWLTDHAVEGDGQAVASAPVGRGQAEHILPPDGDEIAALTAIWLLTTDGTGDLLADDWPEFWDSSEAAPVHPDDEAAIATAMSFLVREKEYA